MMDETIKTILIDDSFTVLQLVDTVCKRIGKLSSGASLLLSFLIKFFFCE
jgi:hypothetical protein